MSIDKPCHGMYSEPFHKDYSLNTKKYDIKILFLIAIVFTFSLYFYLDYSLAQGSNLVPNMLWYSNNSLFQNDVMGCTFHNTFSLDYTLLGIFGQYLPFNILLIGRLFLQNLLALIGMFIFTQYIFNNRNVSYISSLIYTTTGALMLAMGGPVTYHNANLLLSHLAMPLLLICIVLFMEKKYISFGILMGICINIHLFYSFFVLFMLLVYVVFKYKSIKEIVFDDYFWYSIILCIIISLYTIIPIIHQLLTSPPIDVNLWIRLLQLRRVHHSFPLGMGFQWLQFGIGIALFLLSRKYKPDNDKDEQIKIFSFAMIILCIIGIIFADLIPIKFIITISLLRCTNFFIIFVIAYLANYINKYPAGIIILLFGLLFLGTEYHKFGLLLIIAYIVIQYLYSYFNNRIVNKLNLRWYYIIIFLIVVSVFNLLRVQDPTVNEFINVQEWIAINTPKNAIFLTPPDLREFRYKSQHSMFLSYQDLNEPIYSDNCFPIVEERFKIFNINLSNYKKYDDIKLNSDMKIIFYDWNESQILNITQQFNITYLLYQKPNKINFSIIYENNDFIVYKIPGNING